MNSEALHLSPKGRKLTGVLISYNSLLNFHRQVLSLATLGYLGTLPWVKEVFFGCVLYKWDKET